MTTPEEVWRRATSAFADSRDAALAVARISAVTIRRLRAERDEARKSVDELQDELVLLSESNARLRADLAEARSALRWIGSDCCTHAVCRSKEHRKARAALSHQGEPTDRPMRDALYDGTEPATTMSREEFEKLRKLSRRRRHSGEPTEDLEGTGNFTTITGEPTEGEQG